MAAANFQPIWPIADDPGCPGNGAGCAELERQASIARALESPFVAAVLEAGSRHLASAPQTWTLFEQWPGDRASAALALRFNAALHALARNGKSVRLAALFRGEHLDFDAAVRDAVSGHDDFIASWMDHPTQTNEVARSSAILAALNMVAARFGLPFELLELGSSAGLNLNLQHYSHDLGGVAAGTPGSAVSIAPLWLGPPPPDRHVEILRVRGVDLAPLDPGDALTRERLLSYVWADQPARTLRLEQALQLAQRHRRRVDRADAASWLETRLDEPQEAGICRVIFHSMVRQYFSSADRRSVMTSLARAGERASDQRPLAWISFEWTPDRSEVRLACTTWPEGKARHLATCHPYGEWIDWHC